MSVFAPGLLAGRVALITGGATGLGFAIAREYAVLGARTVLVSRKQENLDRAVAEIKASGGESLAVQGDVRHAELQARRVALGRLGRPQDIASAAVYLASPAGDFITGADLIVDGGRWLNYVSEAVE